MGLKDNILGVEKEKVPNMAFRIMSLMMKTWDLIPESWLLLDLAALSKVKFALKALCGIRPNPDMEFSFFYNNNTNNDFLFC